MSEVPNLTDRQAAILAKHAQAETLFSNFHDDVAESRKYYDLDFAEKIVPDRWRAKLNPYIPPMAAQAIDEAVDHILFTPRVRVAVRPGDAEQSLREQEIAENKRNFLSAVWSGQPLIHDARKTLLNEGMVAVKKTINWAHIPKKPGKGASKSEREKYRRNIARLGMDKPIWSFEILDNKTLVFGPIGDHRNPLWAYIKLRITAEEARRLFPKAGDPTDGMGYQGATVRTTETWRDMPDLEEVEYIEFWSSDICDENGEVVEPGSFVQFIESEVVSEEENPYPYIPIAIEDSGYGVVRATAKPEDIFVGLTKKMRPTFEAQAKQFTAWEAVTELTAFGLYIARNRDSSKVWNVGPGEILDLQGNKGEPGAEEFEAVKLPEIPMGVLQLVQETNRIANSVLKMETLGGQPLSGVETATEADQQIRNASAKLASPVAALERLVTRLSTWILMDIEDIIEAPVTVWAAIGSADMPSACTVKPSDIRGYYQVSTELRTTDQEAVNMVKARFWAEMYRVIPFLSAWTAMEKGEISDEPRRELIRRASEDVYLSKEMAMVRTMVGAQSFGEFAEFIQQMVAGGGGPGGEPGAQPGAAPSEPLGVLGSTVPQASPGGAGAARDILQGPSMIRGPRDAQ